jgi:protein gp37
LKVKSKIRFVSFEPLHEDLNLPFDFGELSMIDWAIIGGESGHETGKYRYRPCEIDWISSLKDSLAGAGSAVFIKQLGAHLAKQLKMSDRHGGNIDEFPEHLRVREFPITTV